MSSQCSGGVRWMTLVSHDLTSGGQPGDPGQHGDPGPAGQARLRRPCRAWRRARWRRRCRAWPAPPGLLAAGPRRAMTAAAPAAPAEPAARRESGRGPRLTRRPPPLPAPDRRLTGGRTSEPIPSGTPVTRATFRARPGRRSNRLSRFAEPAIRAAFSTTSTAGPPLGPPRPHRSRRCPRLYRPGRHLAVSQRTEMAAEPSLVTGAGDVVVAAERRRTGRRGHQRGAGTGGIPGAAAAAAAPARAAAGPSAR